MSKYYAMTVDGDIYTRDADGTLRPITEDDARAFLARFTPSPAATGDTTPTRTP